MDEHEHAPHSHRDEHGAVAASLRAAILITLLIFAVEVAGGYVSGSLSLLSDAVHMLGDLFALLLSLAAVLLARQLPTSARTYGYHRAEVLAAFVNGLVLLAVTAGILFSAYDRLRSPPEIEAPVMLAVAVIGLVANLVVIARLHGHGGLGVRSALLHVASDALSSAAVVGAAAVILVTGWTVVDPVLSVLIALLVLASAVRLLRETTAILLQFTPPGLDLEAVTAAMEEVDGVDSVHDVHVWALSSDLYILDGHVVTAATEMLEVEAIKTTLKNRLRRMGIDHVTLEFEAVPCEGCVIQDPDLEADPDAALTAGRAVRANVAAARTISASDVDDPGRGRRYAAVAAAPAARGRLRVLPLVRHDVGAGLQEQEEEEHEPRPGRARHGGRDERPDDDREVHRDDPGVRLREDRRRPSPPRAAGTRGTRRGGSRRRPRSPAAIPSGSAAP